MKKEIYNEQTGIRYELQGDYYLPCLKLPEQPKVEIGIWGKRHLRYIKQHHKIRYTNLLTSCKLTAYLADIDEQAEEMFFRLVKQLAEKEGVTEQLKANNQMLWVKRMNNIRNRATEIVNSELIYT
ncbi:TnpV protein [Ruminococcus difficilis]|uniref:TnpV protein n=1 Tax=Ruminococcus difficilis TaxID=2763069 RepID=A0A935C787_9FIRM|nr:TnpV protein [Ruminococcus difficilis]MBK6089988.1 TnpV protein [Ruminococcus difficilis]